MTQSVYIAGDIQYVSGTVNGTSYIWTMTDDHVWTATGVTKSDSGEYLIELEVTQTDGDVFELSTTAYEGMHLKTDWTNRDYYNATDLNRIGAAVVFLRDKLVENGYNVNVEPNISWTRIDFPAFTSMKNYLLCVEKIRDKLNAEQEIPSTMKKLDANGANDIEKALQEVEKLLNRMISATIVQCGICHTGGYV